MSIKIHLNTEVMFNNFIDTLVSLSRGINAQGLTTNYGQMRGILSFKSREL